MNAPREAGAAEGDAQGGGWGGANGDGAEMGTKGGPLRDRSAVERMLRYGAENIALDADDETFRKFEASDIDSLLAVSSSRVSSSRDSLLAVSSSTKLLASSGEASTFSKV